MRVVDSSRVTYGSQITPHIWEDSNGQLIIRDAVLARCGSYDYLESEIIPGGDSRKIVKVYRTPEEVFNPQSIASFENKPFCNDHPEEDVCLDNYRDLQKGFMRDIRRGTGEYENCLIGDIIVTDPEIIELIKSGAKRELSLGYNTQIIQDEDGKYYMTKIRGNHLALVDDGRAGNATIRDKNSVKNIKGDNEMAKKIVFKPKDKNAFINKLYDEDVVEVEELEDDEDVVIEEVKEKEEEKKVPELHDDEADDFKALVLAKLDEILNLVKSKSVSDEDLPVKEEEKEDKVVVEEPKVDEDITADVEEKEEKVEEEPKLYDAAEDNEEPEIAEEVVEGEEVEEDDDDDTDVKDSAKNLYKGLIGVTDSVSGHGLQDEINQSFADRYKKYGGKN